MFGDSTPLICREKWSDTFIDFENSDAVPYNIYFGTGIVTPKAITKGLPFDFLGFLLSAEHVRRTVGARKVIHLLADEHARVSKKAEDLPMIDRRVVEIKKSIENIIKNLNLEDNYELIMASNLSLNNNYLEIYKNISLAGHGVHEAAEKYVQQQVADMAYMHEHRNTAIKLSWLIDPKTEKIGFDERFFDNIYERIKGNTLSFVYTGPGRSMASDRAKVSPYVLTENTTDRLKMEASPNEVGEYFKRIEGENGRTASGVRNQLGSVVKMYELLYGSLGEGTLCEKVKHVMQASSHEQNNLNVQNIPQPAFR